MKRLKKQPRADATGAIKRRKRPALNDREEEILRAATIHLVFKHGMFLVATGARELKIKGLPVWIITVTLRFDTGHEGYVADLLYDGETFTFLTEQSVMDARVDQIANDPERQRKWDEYRASTLQANEGQHLCTRLPANDPGRVRQARYGKRVGKARTTGEKGNSD